MHVFLSTITKDSTIHEYTTYNCIAKVRNFDPDLQITIKTNNMKNLVLLGRILFALIFILSAGGHFSPETINGVASKVPFAHILVPLSGVIELVGALSILLGYKAKWGAWLIILFLVPVTFTLHQFWTIEDPMAQRMDMVMFMKNIALMGSALLIAYFGSGPLSLDEKLHKTVAQPA